MMRIINLILLVGLLIACNNDDDLEGFNSSDVLVFGTFYGECLGEECVQIYRLENGKIYEDQKDEYPSNISNSYDWNERGQAQFLIAKGLLDSFPVMIQDEKENIIGMPDAGDWGGIYISIERSGSRSIWLVDNLDENVPDYLHSYSQQIREAVQNLR